MLKLTRNTSIYREGNQTFCSCDKNIFFCSIFNMDSLVLQSFLKLFQYVDKTEEEHNLVIFEDTPMKNHNWKLSTKPFHFYIYWKFYLKESTNYACLPFAYLKRFWDYLKQGLFFFVFF